MLVSITTLKRFLFPLSLFFPLLLCAALPLRAGPSKCPRNAYTAVVFVVTNYIAHAFTVVRFPGDTNNDILGRQAYALCAPYVGYLYALAKILNVFDSGRGNELREACRAGAIVHLARNEKWWPRAGDRVFAKVTNRKVGTDQQGGSDVGQCRIEIRSSKLENPRPAPVRDRQYDQIYKIMHEGSEFMIPPGYIVQKCPHNALPQHESTRSEEIRVVEDNADYADYAIPIQSELLLAESILALVQLVLAIASTSLSAGDTVEEYGWAAYSLTVLPFAAMSISNGLANATSRNYPLLHFAKTLEMSEARERMAEPDKFEGFVGRLPQICPEEESYWSGRPPGNGDTWVQFKGPQSGKISVTMKNPKNGQDYLEGWVAENEPENQPPQTGNLTIEVEPSREFERGEEKKLLGWTFAILLAVILYFAPFVIAGALSRFDEKKSTPFQRWAIGIWFWFQGAGIVVIQGLLYLLGVNNIQQASRREYLVYLWSLRIVLGGAGVMLYVVVGMQMATIGVCGA